MRQRTLILRVWNDAAGALQVLVSDPVSELHARLTSAEELWAALEHWSSILAPPHLAPRPPEIIESLPTKKELSNDNSVPQS